jgi:hypothetical protein
MSIYHADLENLLVFGAGKNVNNQDRLRKPGEESGPARRASLVSSANQASTLDSTALRGSE